MIAGTSHTRTQDAQKLPLDSQNPRAAAPGTGESIKIIINQGYLNQVSRLHFKSTVFIDSDTFWHKLNVWT